MLLYVAYRQRFRSVPLGSSWEFINANSPDVMKGHPWDFCPKLSKLLPFIFVVLRHCRTSLILQVGSDVLEKVPSDIFCFWVTLSAETPKKPQLVKVMDTNLHLSFSVIETCLL